MVKEMAKKHLISEELAEAAVKRLAVVGSIEQGAMTIEFQDDFQFLLIEIPCETVRELLQEERKQLGLELDKLMPRREGELTWMLNFTVNGKVVDSYFGGDASSPELGF
jgi:hypothetical protein